jgi:hypothetical protein
MTVASSLPGTAVTRELRRRLTGEPLGITALALATSVARTDGRGYYGPAWRCPSAKASTTLGKLLADSLRICPLSAMIRQRQGNQVLVMKATTRSAPCGAPFRGVLGVPDMGTSNGRFASPYFWRSRSSPGASLHPRSGPGYQVGSGLSEGKNPQDGAAQWACVRHRIQPSVQFGNPSRRCRV